MTKVFQRIPGGMLISIIVVTQSVLCWVYSHLYSVFLAVGPGHILAERDFVILASTILFMIPLSLYRDISKLGKVDTPRL